MLSFTLHGRELTCTAATSLNKWLTVEKICQKYQNNKDSVIHCKKPKYFYKNQGGGGENCGGLTFEPCSVAITMNLGPVVMEMASFCLKIRHVFADTSLTERSIGAGPPVIIPLSGLAMISGLFVRETKMRSVEQSLDEREKFGRKRLKVSNAIILLYVTILLQVHS